jgi:arylsulfatase A
MFQIDKCVGRIIKVLEEEGILNKTLILFSSDNGNDRAIPRVGINSWLGKKGTPMEGGTRVPLIAHWPDVIPVASECHDLISLVDILPTLIEISGGRLPENEPFDGISILPQLTGKKGIAREWIYFEGGTAGPVFDHIEKDTGIRPDYAKGKGREFKVYWRWVRGKRFKLYNDGRFFDMVTDLQERHPIKPGAGSMEAESSRRQLQAVLDQYARLSGAKDKYSFWDS